MNKQNIHKMEYYSTTKRKGILTHALTWMDLKDIRLTSISSHIHKILYNAIEMSSKTQRNKVEWWLLGAGGRRECGMLFNGHRISVL